MPFLHEIRAATTPVEVQHGPVVFRIDCALEKEAETDATKTSEGTTYAGILQARYELELKAAMLRNRTNDRIAAIGNLADVDAFAAQLQSERDAKLNARDRKAAKPFTLEEIEKAAGEKIAAFQCEIETIRRQVNETNEGIRFLRAKSVAYLVAGSDIEDENKSPVFSGKVDKTPEELEADAKILASFSDVLLKKIEDALAGALTGPNPT